MESLNHDCLAEIFQYLPIVDRIRYERVNKLWKEASESSWRSFRNLDIEYLLTSTNLFKEIRTERNKNVILNEFLKRTGRFLKSVYVNIIPDSDIMLNSLNTAVVIQYLNIYCENLAKSIVNVYISERDSKVSDSLFIPLFIRNKGLKTLIINDSKLHGSCLLYISPDSLETLILRDNKIDINVAYKLPQRFRNLKVFHFDSYFYESKNEDADFNEKIIKNLSEGSRSSDSKITELVIQKSSKDVKAETRMENIMTIKELFSGMQYLKNLKLSNFLINDDIIISLSKSPLETMVLYDCNIDLNCVKLDNSHSTLKNLDITYTNINKNFLKLSNLYKNVNFFKLSTSVEISLSEINQLFYTIRTIEILDLSEQFCEQVDDEFLKIIGSNCKCLKAVNLGVNLLDSDSEMITDIGLSYITSIKSLEILLTDKIANITGKSLSFMPNIKELSCHKNFNLENDGLIKLLKTAPYLEILDVSNCKKINNKLIDAAIETVNVRKKKLRIFTKLSGIENSTSNNVPPSITLLDDVPEIPKIFSIEENFLFYI